MGAHYQVSARKYRPQTFDSVVGQSHITTTLKNAIGKGQLAHAYLFCGPRGVGKTSCARILAKTINCLDIREDREACGQCEHCRHFSTTSSFNIFELDAASNNSVEDIRSLTDQVQFAPHQGKYKVYIIDEVHMLSTAAFNAFLKTLEEPPDYALFILATTEKHKILPTILSRCQVFDFKRISTEDMVAHLQDVARLEGAVVEEAGLHVIAQKSEGCMRDALSMLDRMLSFTQGTLTYQHTMEQLNLLDADFYVRMTDAMLAKDLTQVLVEVNEVMDRGFEADVILDGLAGHFRNLLMAKEPGMARLLEVPRDHKALYFEKASQAPPSFILSSLSLLHEALLQIRTAPQKKLHVEVTLIRLCYVLEATAEKKKTGRIGSLNSSENKSSNHRSPSRAREGSPTDPPSAPSTGDGGGRPPASPSREPAQEATATGSEAKAPGAALVEAPPGPPASPAPVIEPTESKKLAAGRPRISRKMMEWSDMEPEAQVESQLQEWDQDKVQGLFDLFIEQQIPERQSATRAQFKLMQLRFIVPDEVRLICPNNVCYHWAMQFRDALIEFFREQTRCPFRVIAEVEEPEPGSGSDDQSPPVLDKLERFARKNPLIKEMQRRLGLQREIG